MGTSTEVETVVIDRDVDVERWRYVCPTPMQHSHWELHDRVFCQVCRESFDSVYDQAAREYIPVGRLEVVEE